jgi:hypothetical protein
VADPIDDRLREIANSDPLLLAICAQMGEPSWADVRAIAAELLAARAEVAEAKRLEGVRLAQIASLQEIIRNDTTPAGVEVARFRAEVERLRADLREAMTLLRAHGQPKDWITRGDAADWHRRYGELLAKHKETT